MPLARDKSARNDIKSVKQMKDKNRITVMVYASPGKKGPLAIVGTAAEPRCFNHLARANGENDAYRVLLRRVLGSTSTSCSGGLLP